MWRLAGALGLDGVCHLQHILAQLIAFSRLYLVYWAQQA